MTLAALAMTARVVAAALALTACRPPERGPRFRAAGASAPRDGGTLRFAVWGAVHSLDPTIGYDEYAYYALRPLFESLVDFAPGGTEIVPRLAERWDISADGLVYRFTLRAGAVFADGAPITAAHLKYSLERALSTPESPFAPFLTDIAGARDVIEQRATACAGITVEGDRVLVIALAQRAPALLAVLAMPFATPQRREHVAAAGDQLRRMPDANGPFELARWDEGDHLVLRRNPRYRGPVRVHLDAIEMRENVPRDSQFLQFERGDLETAEKLSAPDYLYIMAEAAWRPYLHQTVGMNVVGARMNVRQRPFDDRRVRQALNYALDKQHTARLLNGTTIPAHGMLPPGLAGRDDALAPYPHDVARARALLAEAGYPAGFDVEYVIPSDEEIEKISASLQSDLAEAGVRLRITTMAWAAWVSAAASATGPALTFASWTADFPDASNFFDPRFHSRAIRDEGSTNDAFYANPELDRVLDAARGEPDAAARAALYRRAEAILYDDAPWIWDHHRMTTEITQPYVRGYQPHPIWGRDFLSAWLDLGPDGAPLPAEGPGT